MKSLAGWLQIHNRRLLAAALLVLIVLTAVCLYRGWISPLGEGIRVGGVEVGGMTPYKARKVLDDALGETLLTQDLPVQLPEETLILSPDESGFQVHTGKALWAARHAESNSEISLVPYLGIR